MVRSAVDKLPVTVLLAAKNEAVNLPRCLSALQPAQHVILLDSKSADDTCKIAKAHGAQVVQFEWMGGYPKKRQWALEHLEIATDWILLLDADEVVPEKLWNEIRGAISQTNPPDAFIIRKGFHFLGKAFRHGGFSHQAVLLFRAGKARFERLFEDDCSGLDMEVHERVIVDGVIGHLNEPLIHEDFKGLTAYIDRHNRYSTWEAHLRCQYLKTGRYGEETIRSRLFGNSQERRRFLKAFIIRMPGEHLLWFIYHYLFRFGFLDGRPGLIASQLRASYIAQVRAKVFELGKSEASRR